MSSESKLETLHVWSFAGLIVGSTAGVALVTADAVKGGNSFSLSQPLHGLAIMILAILMDTCVTVQVGVYLARRQERFAREIADEVKAEVGVVIREHLAQGYAVWLAKRPKFVKEIVAEVTAELERAAAGEPEPPTDDPAEPQGLTPESVAIGRRISARLNGAHA